MNTNETSSSSAKPGSPGAPETFSVNIGADGSINITPDGNAESKGGFFADMKDRLKKTTKIDLDKLSLSGISVDSLSDRFKPGPVVDPLSVEKVSLRFWSLRGVVMLGLVMVFVVLGGGFVWAVTAKLAQGVVSQGEIVVDTNRKTVQHLEGGIIAQILVKEGELVKEGQPLVVLDDTQHRASVRASESRYFTLLAQMSRLESEYAGKKEIVFRPEILARLEEPIVQETVNTQKEQFQARQEALQGQRSILNQRVVQYEKKIQGLEELRASQRDRLSHTEEELATDEELLKKGNSTKTRILELRRDRAEISGLLSETEADIAEARVAIGESKLQILQLDRNWQSEISDEISQTFSALSEQEEQMNARRDVLTRTVIVSPREGQVVGLRYFTVGGVIPPGSAVMEIVPNEDLLFIHGKVMPTDIDSITLGMPVRVRFSGIQDLNVPELIGVLERVSADVIVSQSLDGQPALSYYEVRASVPEEELQRLPKEMRVVPGMPVELLVQSGERTAWNYLVSPLPTCIIAPCVKNNSLQLAVILSSQMMKPWEFLLAMQ